MDSFEAGAAVDSQRLSGQNFDEIAELAAVPKILQEISDRFRLRVLQKLSVLQS